MDGPVYPAPGSFSQFISEFGVRGFPSFNQRQRVAVSHFLFFSFFFLMDMGPFKKSFLI